MSVLICYFVAVSAAGYQHMLGIVVKKVGIWFLRMISRCNGRPSWFKIPGLLVLGFSVGVLINQLGFVMEVIRLDVEVVKLDKTSSPHSTFQELMQRLPHWNRSFASSEYVVPNIVHYFWSVSLHSCVS